MKYGVIDIGSNSVRLMISDGNNTLYKKVKTTRLAENMCGAVLQSAPMERTADAVSFFVKCAKEENVNEICVFATAAVRQAKNKQAFIDLVKDRTGIDVDVISGESEAQIGIKGALNGADGAIIDVGGASTEVIVTKDGTQIFSKSLNLGVVTLYNEFGQDKTKIENYITDIVFATRYPEEYGLGKLKSLINYGASPRATINLALASRALAFVRRRGYVIPEDVRSICLDVMRHRVGLTYEAEAENIKSEDIITEIINRIDVP